MAKPRWVDEEDRKGLRFEVKPFTMNGHGDVLSWGWELVGADGVVAISPVRFDTEKAARSHISANKGRLKAAQRSKVLTVNQMMLTIVGKLR